MKIYGLAEYVDGVPVLQLTAEGKNVQPLFASRETMEKHLAGFGTQRDFCIVELTLWDKNS